MAYTGDGANNLITLSQLYDGLAAAKTYTDKVAASVSLGTLTQTINNSSKTYSGSTANWGSIYAPTSSNNVSYELVSTRNGAPVWRPPCYGVCSTTATTQAKTVTIDNFSLAIAYSSSSTSSSAPGQRVAVLFQDANTAAKPTLNVNGTGAYPIYFNDTNATTGNDNRTTWLAGETIEFIFTGGEWIAMGRSCDILSNFYSNGYTNIDEITAEFTDTFYNSSTIRTAVSDLCNDLYTTGVVDKINATGNTELEYQLTAKGELISITLPGLDTINTALINTGRYTDGIGNANSDLGIVTFFEDLNDVWKGTYTHGFAGMEEIADSVATLLSKFSSVEVASDADVSDMLATVFS